VVGSDFAGVITKIGKDIEKLDDLRAKVGMRVANFVQGGRLSSIV
jgi:NADPH:quinone reductase-like Zn-dependent oxidoreductase